MASSLTKFIKEGFENLDKLEAEKTRLEKEISLAEENAKYLSEDALQALDDARKLLPEEANRYAGTGDPDSAYDAVRSDYERADREENCGPDPKQPGRESLLKYLALRRQHKKLQGNIDGGKAQLKSLEKRKSQLGAALVLVVLLGLVLIGVGGYAALGGEAPELAPVDPASALSAPGSAGDATPPDSTPPPSSTKTPSDNASSSSSTEAPTNNTSPSSSTKTPEDDNSSSMKTPSDSTPPASAKTPSIMTPAEQLQREGPPVLGTEQAPTQTKSTTPPTPASNQPAGKPPPTQQSSPPSTPTSSSPQPQAQTPPETNPKIDAPLCTGYGPDCPSNRAFAPGGDFPNNPIGDTPPTQQSSPPSTPTSSPQPTATPTPTPKETPTPISGGTR